MCILKHSNVCDVDTAHKYPRTCTPAPSANPLQHPAPQRQPTPAPLRPAPTHPCTPAPSANPPLYPCTQRQPTALVEPDTRIVDQEGDLEVIPVPRTQRGHAPIRYAFSLGVWGSGLGGVLMRLAVSRCWWRSMGSHVHHITDTAPPHPHNVTAGSW